MSTQYEKRKQAKKAADAASEITVESGASDLTVGEVEGVDRDAYDVFLNPETNKYIRVRINYNLERGTVEIVEVKDYADGQAVAQAKINELFVRKMFKLTYK